MPTLKTDHVALLVCTARAACTRKKNTMAPDGTTWLDMPTSIRTLPLLGGSAGGCGCDSGSHGTGGHQHHRGAEGSSAVDATRVDGAYALEVADASSQAFAVTGMTCGHCVSAVSAEVGRLEGVTDVAVLLVAGGTSRVTIRSRVPLASAEIAAALEEAGGYRLAE